MAYGYCCICCRKEERHGFADYKASSYYCNLLALSLDLIVLDKAHNRFSSTGSRTVRNTGQYVIHVSDIHEIDVLAGVDRSSHVFIRQSLGKRSEYEYSMNLRIIIDTVESLIQFFL